MCRLDYLPLCTIAGSDPTGGAGLQGDLRTFAAHTGHGTAVTTAFTVQDRAGLRAVTPVDAAVVRPQIDWLLENQRPMAMKTGMLATAGILAAVADGLDAFGAPPLVVDPVLSAEAGGALLAEEALAALAERLAPHAALLTPNLPEAARLLGREEIRPGEEADAAHALLEQGWRAVLLKGGHSQGLEVQDLLVDAHGVRPFRRLRIAGGPYHGTGCALSAAVAARLGRGEALPYAVEGATAYVQALLKYAHERGDWLLSHLAVRPLRR